MAFYRQQLSKFEQTKWWFSEQQYTAFFPSSLSPFRRKFDNQFRCYLQELDLLFQLWELLNCKATGLKATAKPNTPSNHSNKTMKLFIRPISHSASPRFAELWVFKYIMRTACSHLRNIKSNSTNTMYSTLRSNPLIVVARPNKPNSSIPFRSKHLYSKITFKPFFF